MDKRKLQEELDTFKKYLVLQYPIREITIKGHLGNIRRMLQTLQTTNPEKEQAEEYVYLIRNSDRSASHQCNTISSIEKYMDFKKKLVRFAKPKRPQVFVKEILTEAEITSMLQNCKDIREKAILMILAYSGVRNRSFCNIKVKDVDFGTNTIVIRKSKGRKEYMSNIPSEAIKILLRYLEEYPRKSESYLFTTKFKGNQYAPSDMRKLIKTIAKRARIEKRVYVHLLRHSLASNMLNRGANILLIKEQLGHDFLESTMVYAHSFPQRIKSEYEIYKPAYL